MNTPSDGEMIKAGAGVSGSHEQIDGVNQTANLKCELALLNLFAAYAHH
jgi:hypothetical protein